MKKIFFVPIAIFANYYLSAQTVTRLQQIPELTPSLAAKWSKAAMQNDVIGNDFFVDQKIGLNTSDRFHSDWDGWLPVDGYKRTLAGISDKIYPFYEGYNNYDLNIVIKENDILNDFKPLYSQALSKGLSKDDDAGNEGLEIEFDQTLSNGNNLFISGINKPKIKSEVKPDSIFAFGPLVLDINHDHKPEIHPAEQVWWRRKENNTDNFYLFFSCDQSDRFDDKRDFDLNEGEEQQFIPWAVRPLKGLFAIPFIITPGKTKARFNIGFIGASNAKNNFTDQRTHFLVYNKDTLATVKENFGSGDYTKVSFQNICYGFNSPNGSVLGYIVLQMEAGKANTGSILDNDQGGYLFLKVQKEILPIISRIKINSSSITN